MKIFFLIFVLLSSVNAHSEPATYEQLSEWLKNTKNFDEGFIKGLFLSWLTYKVKIEDGEAILDRQAVLRSLQEKNKSTGLSHVFYQDIVEKVVSNETKTLKIAAFGGNPRMLLIRDIMPNGTEDLLIGFSGTQGLSHPNDIVKDLKSGFGKLSATDESIGSFHRGMLEAANEKLHLHLGDAGQSFFQLSKPPEQATLVEYLTDYLQTRPGGRSPKLIVGGHSLGAGTAEAFGMLFYLEKGDIAINQTRIVALAPPKTMGERSQRFFHRLFPGIKATDNTFDSGRSLVLINRSDPVTIIGAQNKVGAVTGRHPVDAMVFRGPLGVHNPTKGYLDPLGIIKCH